MNFNIEFILEKMALPTQNFKSLNIIVVIQKRIVILMIQSKVIFLLPFYSKMDGLRDYFTK